MSYIKFTKSQKYLLILIIILIFMLVLSLILISRSLDPEISQTNPQLRGCEGGGDILCYSWLKVQNGVIFSLVEGRKLEEIGNDDLSFAKVISKHFRLISGSKLLFQKKLILLNYRVLTIQESLEGIQAKIMKPLEEHIWENNLALVQGFVFGDDDQISIDTREKFRMFGLYHVLAASGSNLSLWIMPLAWIIPRYSRKIYLLITSFWAIIYLLLLGDNPPVARAVSMLILGQLGSKLFLKQVSRQRLLLVSAIILLSFSSSYLESLSFWMSILATWAMIFFMSDDSLWLKYLLGEEITRVKWSFLRLLFESYQASWAAQLMLAPIFIWFFEEFSWAGLVVGPLFTPLVEIVIQLSFSLVFWSAFTSFWSLGEFLLDWLARVYAYLASFILYLLELVPIKQGAWKLATRGPQLLFLGLWGLVFLVAVVLTRRKPNRKATFFYE